MQAGSQPILRALAGVYGFVVGARNALYDRGWLPVGKLPCRVISVGNLTVGGTGKTPVVIWLADRLLAHGSRIGVLSRGYRRRSRATKLLVSDGRKILAGPADAGDEPYLIARRCPAAVVAVGADRFSLGRWVLEQFPLDYLLLDDGFQHRRLHRDVDLVLVDASAPDSLCALLPAGLLREPMTSMRRATALLLTRVEAAGDLDCVLTRLRAAVASDLPTMLLRFEFEGCVNLHTGLLEPMTRLAGKSVVILSGIANHTAFRRLLERHGVKVIDEAVFPDHHTYTTSDLDWLRAQAVRIGAEAIVTTEKDAVKIEPLLDPGDSIWAVRLRTEIVQGREQLEQLITKSGER